MIDETKMRRGEVYHGIRVPDGNHIILRIDGRAFHTHVKTMGYERPYDRNFNEKMVEATKLLVREFNALFGYTQSDEISVLLPINTDIYDREVEKLVSLSASIVTAGYNLNIEEGEEAGFFDSRVWVSGSQNDVYEYFHWRIGDAWRNCVNAWAYWEARKMGMSPSVAHKYPGKNRSEMHEFLMVERGINPANLPEWQKNGVGVFWVDYSKEGYNPKTQEKVLVKRRALIEEAPHKDVLGWLRNRVFDVAMIDKHVVQSQVSEFSGW